MGPRESQDNWNKVLPWDHPEMILGYLDLRPPPFWDDSRIPGILGTLGLEGFQSPLHGTILG
jgi:hypothetical protein